MHSRFVTKHFARKRDVRLRVADISFPRRIVLSLNFFPGDLFEHLQHLVQADPRSGATIENFPRRILALARAKRLIHHIVDVSEIARLFAISIDSWRLTLSTASMNRESTPEYCDAGSCRGPKTLKYRNDTFCNP